MDVREYPYGKSVLLNAVYDVLERLAIPLSSADSRTGVIRFAGGKMELTAVLRDGGAATRVEIESAGRELATVLLDELHATLQHYFEMKRRTAV
ncbi:MAG: hypothetical protein IJJ99_00655 [Oscillospiraceae bacterium]|nr:hypothetical protein [Oscillospiraceae bacterium]